MSAERNTDMKWSRFLKSDRDDFVPGEFNVICEASGMKIKSSEAVKQWDGRIVRRDLEEFRNPQDFLRSNRESSTPWSRPEPTDNFGQTDSSEL